MTVGWASRVPLSRRRFIAITAAVAGAGIKSALAGADPYRTFSWRGVALGASASLTLEHHDEAEVKAAIAACLAEVARLEKIFSLHLPESALCRLNRDGRLDAAPMDLCVLLAEALSLAERTQGAFDPTVQPLWQLYARHFGAEHSAPEGPSDADIRDAVQRVGWHKVTIQDGALWFAEPGMALTLNGMAQGYITDRVGALLRARGFEHVLVNMGEQLAAGPKWDGNPWSIGIASPFAPHRIVEQVPLKRGAVATSAASGYTFDSVGRLGHILDPRSGRPAANWASMTVVSARAAMADGLSTALSVTPPAQAAALLGSESRAYAIALSGETAGWL